VLPHHSVDPDIESGDSKHNSGMMSGSDIINKRPPIAGAGVAGPQREQRRARLRVYQRLLGARRTSKIAGMCDRFTQTAAFNVLAERFGITVEDGTNEEVTAPYNVSPTQTCHPRRASLS